MKLCNISVIFYVMFLLNEIQIFTLIRYAPVTVELVELYVCSVRYVIFFLYKPYRMFPLISIFSLILFHVLWLHLTVQHDHNVTCTNI